MMNGESRAFEIKTQFDSSRRLSKQIGDYRKVFNKCYIVISTEELSHYESIIEPFIGIVELYTNKGKIKVREHRPATKQIDIDAGILMKCLRTQEYINIVRTYYGSLPAVNSYEMYDACKVRLGEIPSPQLNELFLNEIKKRKSATNTLKMEPRELRQMFLSLNLSSKESNNLKIQLSNSIKRSELCISRI